MNRIVVRIIHLACNPFSSDQHIHFHFLGEKYVNNILNMKIIHLL